jgi:type 1 glutamine amidotransferase
VTRLALPLFAAAILVAQRPDPIPAKRIQILIITGREDHDWRGVTSLMRQYLDSAAIFETRIAEEFRDTGPDALRSYDAAVLVYSDKAPQDHWSERAQSVLQQFVRSGKGLVVYHHSSTAFKNWPEYARLSGGNFYGNAQHSDPHDFTVDIRDRQHPITRGLPKSFRQQKDELYANMQMQPPGTYHVLATGWDDHALYAKTKAPLSGAGTDEPLLWTVDYGSGRVFSMMIGHDPGAMQSAGWRAVFTRGVEWAATGSVTQPAPAGFSESEPNR